MLFLLVFMYLCSVPLLMLLPFHTDCAEPRILCWLQIKNLQHFDHCHQQQNKNSREEGAREAQDSVVPSEVYYDQSNVWVCVLLHNICHIFYWNLDYKLKTAFVVNELPFIEWQTDQHLPSVVAKCLICWWVQSERLQGTNTRQLESSSILCSSWLNN